VIFKNILAEKLGENVVILNKNAAILWQKLIIA
jgi:hypothetical protein